MAKNENNLWKIEIRNEEGEREFIKLTKLNKIGKPALAFLSFNIGEISKDIEFMERDWNKFSPVYPIKQVTV